MPFIRHRDRMVQESVYEDLDNTLIACRWKAGTTTRALISPFAPGDGRQIITTTESQVLKIVGKTAAGAVAQVNLIDFFPETGGATTEEEAAVGTETGHTVPNTLAIDDGSPGDSAPLELGSDAVEQPYLFTMAFYASSDSVAKALMNDLRDRYMGRIVEADAINLYDYNTDPEVVVARMEVDVFRSNRNLDSTAPSELFLYFAELQITDFVED